jgi:release factor glutamine methyltransferase
MMSQNAPPHAYLTVEQAQRSLRDRFKNAAIETYELDARILTGFAVGLDDVGLITQASRSVTEREYNILEKTCLARLEGKPVSRITGVKEFYSLPFQISSATLDPRPDSECLVESALIIAEKLAKLARKPLRVLDLGTGSGCLLIAFAHACQQKGVQVEGLGVDISSTAIRQARINAALNGIEYCVDFKQSNWFENVSGRFDIIISNPPYIASDEIEGLAPEVRFYDPSAALDGGSDGLDAYKHIIAAMTTFIKPGGFVLFEIGSSQAALVTDIVRQSISTHQDVAISCVSDLAGLDRVLQLEFNQNS